MTDYIKKMVQLFDGRLSIVQQFPGNSSTVLMLNNAYFLLKKQIEREIEALQKLQQEIDQKMGLM